MVYNCMHLLDKWECEGVQRILHFFNTYITEKERIVELKLDATTINYKDCLVDSYRGVEDPFGKEIQDLQYAQNPIDPSQVIREPIFKKDALSDGQVI